MRGRRLQAMRLLRRDERNRFEVLGRRHRNIRMRGMPIMTHHGLPEEFDEHSRDLAWIGGMFALASVIFSIWIIISLIEMVVR